MDHRPDRKAKTRYRYTPCSSRNNYDARRLFYLENQNQGQYYGVVAQLDDGATSNYHALLLSVQHRRTNGLDVAIRIVKWGLARIRCKKCPSQRT